MTNYEEMYFEVLKENHRLRFEVAISKINKWSIEAIVSNPLVREQRHIMFAFREDLKQIVPLLNEFGYEHLNDYFMRLVDEVIEKEEVKEQEEM